jgi:hypothetical protein
MKAANFHRFPVAKDESTDMSDAAKLVAFVHGIDMEFNLLTFLLTYSMVQDII